MLEPARHGPKIVTKGPRDRLAQVQSAERVRGDALVHVSEMTAHARTIPVLGDIARSLRNVPGSEMSVQSRHFAGCR
jgi:hypothetical protein